MDDGIDHCLPDQFAGHFAAGVTAHAIGDKPQAHFGIGDKTVFVVIAVTGVCCANDLAHSVCGARPPLAGGYARLIAAWVASSLAIDPDIRH